MLSYGCLVLSLCVSNAIPMPIVSRVFPIVPNVMSVRSHFLSVLYVHPEVPCHPNHAFTAEFQCTTPENTFLLVSMPQEMGHKGPINREATTSITSSDKLIPG